MRSILGVLSAFRPSICAPPFRQFHPLFFCRQHSLFTDGVTNGIWSKLLSGGGTRVLRVLAVFREYSLCCEHSNIYEFNTLDTLSIPTISDDCRAGTACTRGSVLLIILPVLAVSRPSVLVLLIFPARAVFRTPRTRSLRYTQHQQYPESRTPQ